MIRPDLGKYPITQGFGAPGPLYGPAGHDGIDLGTPVGTPLYAPRSGIVKDVNTNTTYGLRVKINNGTNIDYVGHLSEAKVSIGQHVNEGQLIALSGASGNVTGPHTHWGVYTYSGTPINPQAEMDKVNKEKTMVDDEGANILMDFMRHTLGVGASPSDKGALVGKPWKQALVELQNGPEYPTLAPTGEFEPLGQQAYIKVKKG